MFKETLIKNAMKDAEEWFATLDISPVFKDSMVSSFIAGYAKASEQKKHKGSL